ncbi:MAG: two-component system, NarL family, sensor kinase [Actinomycetota bacterium]|nr:two-component system, NarL family, sensor kinase [Actinomycetota bacterium]
MVSRGVATAGGLACVVAAIAASGLSVWVGWSFDDALRGFVVSNVLIGLGFGLCGALIAWHRPSLLLGWLYLAGGSCQLATAVAAPLGQRLHDIGASQTVVRADLAVFNWAWPLHIGLVLPLSLFLLPDGRFLSPRWRRLGIVVAATSPLFVIETGTAPTHFAGLPQPYGALRDYGDLSWLWTVSELRWSLCMVAGVVALVVRYRQGDEQLRRQMLWLVAAAAFLVVAVVPFGLIAGTPIVVLFALPLLPAAVAVAVLRHQLLDIRLVIARGATYALLSGLVLAAYAALVAVLSGVTSALVVALVALPVRARLQRSVDRLLYGERADPLRVASRVGVHIATGLQASLAEVREALRLPYVGVRVAGAIVAFDGELSGPSADIPLHDASLVVGLRPGEKRLSPTDERVLALLAGPLAAAVQATRLSAQLQVSRERLVLAREEERRRLRRDLHDGLGPLLTGVALSADAASNLGQSAPAEAAALMNSVRTETRTAIGEVRRIVDDLRPPALDELGLVAALEVRAAQLSRRLDGQALAASVDAPGALPSLPAAVEVAAYRIATEAMTNVVRHSDASRVVVRLECSDALVVEIDDDGAATQAWHPGVGLTAMQERAAELGGRCEAGPTAHGGRVRVSLPLVMA